MGGKAGTISKDQEKEVKSKMKKMKDLEKKRDKEEKKEEKKKKKEEAKRKKEEEEEAKRLIRKSAALAPPPTMPLPSISLGSPSPVGSPRSPAADPRRLNASVGGGSPADEKRDRKFSSRITKLITGDSNPNAGAATTGEGGATAATTVSYSTAELFTFVREGNVAELRKAFSFPPQGFNLAQQIETKSGDTLLHVAVSSNQPNEEIVKAILKSRGSDAIVNVANKSRLTPLFCAVMINAKPKIVSLLSN